MILGLVAIYLEIVVQEVTPPTSEEMGIKKSVWEDVGGGGYAWVSVMTASSCAWVTSLYYYHGET